MKYLTCLVVFLVTASVASAQAVTPADPQAVSLGSWGAAILQWVLAITAPALGILIVALIYKVSSWLGVQMDISQREKLQDIVVNGINLAARNVEGHMQGQYPMQVKNQLAIEVMEYVKAHGSDTLKSLGLDVNDPRLPQIIAARVSRAINDPMAPTPSWLTPPEVRDMIRTRQSSTTGTDGVEQKQTDQPAQQDPVDTFSRHVTFKRPL